MDCVRVDRRGGTHAPSLPIIIIVNFNYALNSALEKNIIEIPMENKIKINPPCLEVTTNYQNPRIPRKITQFNSTVTLFPSQKFLPQKIPFTGGISQLNQAHFITKPFNLEHGRRRKAPTFEFRLHF